MLLRFSVSNFGSLRDKQELSMIASQRDQGRAGRANRGAGTAQ